MLVLVVGTLVGTPRPASAQVLTAAADANPNAIAHVRIDTLYGSRNLVVGHEENYRVRIQPDAAWPVIYDWDMGDGVRSRGNNVVHRYQKPGYYTLRVVAHNRYDADSTFTVIRVRPANASSTGRVVFPAPEPTRTAGSRSASRDVGNDESSSGSADASPISSEYYSWLLESHFSNAAAQAALKRLRTEGIGSARVYVDRSGSGSVAYRVVVGSYTSTRSALMDRPDIQEKAGRSVSLFTIRQLADAD